MILLGFKILKYLQFKDNRMVFEFYISSVLSCETSLSKRIQTGRLYGKCEILRHTYIL